jgi:hypothetical protein
MVQSGGQTDGGHSHMLEPAFRICIGDAFNGLFQGIIECFTGADLCFSTE